jgi:NADP-dependent 3-hydroxy acid dehydrogenase YdfG
MKKLVAITGASSGIGAATAKLFSEQGYPLLLMARRLDQMRQLGLPNCLCRQVDVMDLPLLKAVISEAEDQFGSVDCLVNNAGLMYLGLPWEQSIEEWREMVDVNILGVMNGIRSVLEGMIARRSGTIINMGSLAGIKTFQKHAAYCATKFGVHALSETIREEVAQFKVRVITVAPGAVETELITHTAKPEHRQDWWDGLNGILQKEDVARVILFAYQQPQEVCLREIVITPTGAAA